MTVEAQGDRRQGAGAELPAIGIVVPSFNQARYLGEALESIFRQDYPRLEVAVMDGGSTDGSVDVIRSWADRLVHWQSAPDDGQSAAINEGMRHLSGDIVAWLNSDDTYWGDCLWTVGRAWAEHPEAGLYFGNGLRHVEREDAYRLFCPRHTVLNRRALREGPDYILQPSTFFARRAWLEVGGLDESLHYCMDWDVFLRIAESFSAVTINEILAVSREYEATKTSRGALRRCEEIARMVQARSGREVTAGSLNYLLETLIDLSAGSLPAVYPHLKRAMLELRGDLGRVCGVGDGWPESGDAQDRAYLPLARRRAAQRPCFALETALPPISVIVPLTDRARFLDEALDSIADQDGPPAEILVCDARSSGAPLDALGRHADRITVHRCDPARGPVHAIRQGLARARGLILGWLDPDDLLADGALAHVGRAFADQPDLDMLYANAVYVDDRGRLALADHGVHRTAYLYGRMPSPEPFSAYWRHEDWIAQPTVFLRARLLEDQGGLDESYRHVHAFELFWRLAKTATVRKLDRTQALVRLRDGGAARDPRYLAELYRFSRARWPRAGSGGLRPVVRDFVVHYMQNRCAAAPRDLRFWSTAALVALSALTRLGNPEAWRVGRRPDGPRPGSAALTAPLSASHVIRDGECAAERRPYFSLFCSLAVPEAPSRAYQLLRCLAELGRLEVFALAGGGSENGRAASGPFDELHTPERIRREHPEWLDPSRLAESLATRAGVAVRRGGFPVVGPRYPLEVTEYLPPLIAFLWRSLQETLTRERPDFLFVNPQLNPMALLLHTRTLHTRLVLVAHAVEAVEADRRSARPSGLKWLADNLEMRRAERFERRNLALYDGLIAASEEDKAAFVERYGFDPRRVLVVAAGAGTGTWEAALDPLAAWLQWLGTLPRRTARRAQAYRPRIGSRR